MKLIFIEEHCQSITKTTTIQYGTNSTVVVWPAAYTHACDSRANARAKCTCAHTSADGRQP